MIPRRGEIWQHYKTKGEYKIIELATMQSKVEFLDMQPCVIYTAPNGSLWVRPLADFIEHVFNERGEEVTRFMKKY